MTPRQFLNGDGTYHPPELPAIQAPVVNMRILEQRAQINELVINEMSLRARFINQAMDKRRDIDKDCGFTEWIPAEMYQRAYSRDSLSARVVEVFPKESWQTQPRIFEEAGGEKATTFEEAFDGLGRTLRGGEQSFYRESEGHPLWGYCQRLDILQGVGSYGVMLIGLDDGLALNEPVEGVEELFSDPIDPETGEEPKDGAETDDPDSPDEPGAEEEDDGDGSTDRGQYAGSNGSAGKKYGGSGEGDLQDGGGSGKGSGKKKAGAGKKKKPKFVQNRAIPGVYSLTWNALKVSKPLPKKPGKQEQDDGTDVSGDDQEDQTDADGQDVDEEGVDGAGPIDPETGEPETEALDGGSEKRPFAKPLNNPKGKNLKYLRVFPEVQAQITQIEGNITSPRFGQPVMYLITFNDNSDNGPGRTGASAIGASLMSVNVHWTRVVHVCDNWHQATSSEVFAPPRMECVWNDLHSLRKIAGADGEGYYKAGIPGMALETDPSLGNDVEVNIPAARQMLQDYQNGLQKAMINVGLTAKTLAPSMVDPTPHFAIHEGRICTKLGIPIRVWKGSERGELASSQDDGAWNDRIRNRQYTYITPRIVCPVVDRFIQIGILPVPVDGYYCEWDDVASLTKNEKATILGAKVTAYTAYAGGAMAQQIPPLEFMTKFDDFSEDEAKAILEAGEIEAQAAEQEQLMLDEENAALAEEHGLKPQIEGFVDPDAPPPIVAKPGTPPVDGGKSAVPPKKPPIANELETNVFCPTGEGGGIDPSCGKGGSSGTSLERATKLLEHQNSAADEYSAAFKEVGGKMWSMDLAKRTSPGKMKEAAEHIAQVLDDGWNHQGILKPLMTTSVLKTIPADKLKGLRKKIDEIHAKYTEKVVELGFSGEAGVD